MTILVFAFIASPATFPLNDGYKQACVEPELCFSPHQDCDHQVVEVIDSAKFTLDVWIYSINRPAIVDAILRAKSRGVTVRMLLDRLQMSNTKERAQLARLVGVPFKFQHHKGIDHVKAAIVDKARVAFGSFNWTNEASENNDEVLAVYDCERTAQRFESAFSGRWDDWPEVKQAASQP